MGESTRTGRCGISILAAALLLAYLAALAPHLAHHLAEHGHHASSEATCPFLVLSQQTAVDLGYDPPTVDPPRLAADVPISEATLSVSAQHAETSRPRAPPEPWSLA